MSHRRPTVACLLFLLFISPLCGVAPTPDCGIIIPAVSSRGVIQTLVWHPVFYFWLLLPTCVHHEYFVYLVTDAMIIEYFLNMFSLDILYPCSKCLRVHSNVLTGLSLAIVLARFLAWRRALRRQPRNPCKGDSNLAKIGVILVSCSCGKWSPIDADEPQTASAINH